MSIPQNSKLSERLAVLASIISKTVQGTSAGTVTSSAFNIAGTNNNYFGRYLVAVNCSNTNIATVQVVKASDSALTSATAITGLSQTMNSSTNTMLLMDINGATQALNDTLNTWLGVQVITTSAGAMLVGATVFGSDGRYDPASNWNTLTNATIASV